MIPNVNQKLEFSHYFTFAEDPFYTDDEFSITYQRVVTLSKQEAFFIRCQEVVDIYPNYNEIYTILLNEQIQRCQLIQKPQQVLYGFHDGGLEIWIICNIVLPLSLNEYLTKQSIKNDEKIFLVIDIINLATELIQIPFDINFDTFSLLLVRNSASPFPKITLSPLAFIRAINGPQSKKQPFTILQQLSEVLKLMGPFEGCTTIISAFENNTDINTIINSPLVQQWYHFVTGNLGNLSGITAHKLIGRGQYGVVLYGNDGNKEVAIKESNRDKIDTLQREATILRLCDHPNVVKFHSFIIANESLCFRLGISNVTLNFPRGYLVMEYCDGGSLENFVNQYSKHDQLLPLPLVSNLFKQIALCQHYLHFEKGLIHRDIKLENFLLVKNNPYPILKICDFGFGRAIADKMVSFNCTPLFAAPEFLRHTPYSAKSDLYSIGVCLYILTTCMYPFGNTKAQFYQQMMEMKTVTFPQYFLLNNDYSMIIDLIKQLMVHDEEKRISWEQFYAHPYMLQILNS
ncbi:Protein kinase domain containing protein [Entamoeba marina]